MREDLDAALCRDFPNLYRERYENRPDSIMQYGFTCGDGWEPLIRRASAQLEALILALPEAERPLYRAQQVKSKFGGLRLYMPRKTPEMDAVLRVADAESFTLCEVCGAEASRQVSKSGRVATFCPPCVVTEFREES